MDRRIRRADHNRRGIVTGNCPRWTGAVRVEPPFVVPNEREVIVEYCDGVRPTESPLAETLRSVGFYGTGHRP